jgi:hypothetical protein
MSLRSSLQKAPSSARSLGVIFEDELTPIEEAPPIDFRKTEVETIQKVLDRIDQVSAKRISEGFSKRNFMLGVLNYLFLAFILGAFPQHFWLCYIVEMIILLPMKISDSSKSKPLCQILYYLDYCWVMNLSFMAIGVALVMDACTDKSLLSDDMRASLFVTVYGISCGPLLGATIVLPFVAVVFHDFIIMTGLFIHILPPMVLYTIKWQYQDIHDAWPRLFKLHYIQDVQFFPSDSKFIIPGTGLGTIAGNTIFIYFLWFVPYVIWMLVWGMNLPRKQRTHKDGTVTTLTPMYDTVFHATVRTGLTAVAGKALWGRPTGVSRVQMENDDYETRDFLVYMTMHAILACSAVYILAYPCYISQTFHTIMLIFLTVICVARGAERYVYYVCEMYSRAVRKDFAELLEEKSIKTK